ncbi:MAG: bifunctional phosphopantothenoylcysteine decarboxylase/phosphopantothenate--cysteine ligase CoaBC [Actinobacteria bacterium]|nr:bifunctional phosphopantothenoylcysteine decarboxylase/phosphopantothenate--cysteine ligase CoaBC [Actinomycetota bacterium]MCG2801916.1 bifunctional phosphopantothenoylcysteine decarboxylase/phosphopantothenate--cysteine ligase CoaBC [Cellulomonas sp.]
MRVVLGVGGGIAAYKAVLLLRLLREAGHSVRVVPTAAALRFVGRPTWEALSGEPATADLFDDVDQVAHVEVGRSADLVIVAPATADLLARASSGRADDLLTATLLVATCPVLMAPAMHTQMWQHPATVANVALLRARGVHVLDPADGRLTGADSGPGRLPEPEVIATTALGLLRPHDLAGRHVVISAGGTREPVDPVRFLGNRSSGRQGLALASTAAVRGARVTLVAANVEAPAPSGVEVVRVQTAEQLREAVLAAAKDADVVVMAAAVADFRPAAAPTAKIKKDPGGAAPVIELVQNPDILTELAAHRSSAGQVVVGFAAETGDASGSVLEHGRTKAVRKGADLLVVNAVGDGRGFEAPTNEVTVLDGSGRVVTTAAGSKQLVADVVWDTVLPRLAPTCAASS